MSTHWTDGWPLAVLATALTASLIPWPSMWQVMALLVLLVLSPAVGKRKEKRCESA